MLNLRRQGLYYDYGILMGRKMKDKRRAARHTALMRLATVGRSL